MEFNPGPASTLTRNTQPGMASSDSNRPLVFLQSFYSSPTQQLSSIPTWVKLTSALSYLSFATAGTTYNLPLFLLPGGGIIHGIKIIPRVAFAGPSISAYTISVGTATSAAQLASAFSMTGTPGSTNLQLSSNFIEYDDVASTQIIAQALSTGANLNAATAGVVDIYALLSTAF